MFSRAAAAAPGLGGEVSGARGRSPKLSWGVHLLPPCYCQIRKINLSSQRHVAEGAHLSAVAQLKWPGAAVFTWER